MSVKIIVQFLPINLIVLIGFIFFYFPNKASEFIEKNNHVCSGKVISDHVSLSIAKEECIKDSRCNGIFDVGCSAEMFWTCTGNMKPGFILKNNVGSSINQSASIRAWERGNKEQVSNPCDNFLFVLHILNEFTMNIFLIIVLLQ